MMDQSIMFILQGCFAVLMLFFGIILNSMRQSIESVRVDLKLLNDAVLGKYVQHEDLERKLDVLRSVEVALREASDHKWEAQRALDHELRDALHGIQIEFARIKAKEEKQ